MTTPLTLVVASGVLAIGTLAFRLAGPALRNRIEPSPRAEQLLTVTAVVVFAALVAISALFDGHQPAGIARPIGVAVGGVLAWKKAPFVIVVLAAAATAAVLRLVGLP